MKTLDWNQTFDVPATGRAVKVSDGVETYVALVPEGLSFRDACEEFGAGYDGATADRPARACCYTNGEEEQEQYQIDINEYSYTVKFAA